MKLMKKISSSAHQNNFDWLRLIFASMVVLAHIGILTQREEFSWMMKISAGFAVQAFFVVSGYLVTMSCEKSKSLGDYARKRISRIAPAYIFVVVAAAVCLSLMSSLGFREYFSSTGFWRYIGMNLALANFSAPSLPGVFTDQYESAVNVSLWTIKVEVLFYLCAPVIVLAVKRLGYRKALLTIFLLSTAWMLGFSLLGSYTGNEFYLKLAKQLPGQMTFFVGGAWCYYATRDGGAPSGWMALLGLLFYATTSSWLFLLGAPIAVAAIVSWAALTLKYLGNIGKHGDFSFGIYLFHVPIVQTLIALGYFSSAPYLTLSLAILIVAMAGILSWNFIEKPFLNRGKSIVPSPTVLSQPS